MRGGVPKEIKVHEYRVGLTPASVAERLSYRRHLHTQVAFFDEQARPHSIDNFLGTDEFARAIEEQGQYGDCTAAQRDFRAVVEQQALFRI